MIQVKFFPSDLHTHTPASFDYNYLDDIETLFGNDSAIINEFKKEESYKDREEKIFQILPPQKYYSIMMEKLTEYAQNQNLNEFMFIIGATDHQVCKYSCDLAKLGLQSIKEKNKIIPLFLPGMELNADIIIQDPIDKSDLKLLVHIITLFRPGIEYEDMRAILKLSGSDKIGNYGDSKYEIINFNVWKDNLRNHSNNNDAIIIGAHVMGQGIASELKKIFEKKYLSENEAKYIKFVKDLELLKNKYKSDTSKIIIEKITILEKSIELIKKEVTEEKINNDWLEYYHKILNSEPFDALQVQWNSNMPDEPKKYYATLRKKEDDDARNALIVASDSHRLKDLLDISNAKTWLKLDLSSLKSMPSDDIGKKIFYEIKNRALRLGETRSLFFPYIPNRAYIKDVELSIETENDLIWDGATEENNKKTQRFNFSPDLTCLIGGRGSGKSTIIEYLAYSLTDEKIHLKTSWNNLKERLNNSKEALIIIYLVTYNDSNKKEYYKVTCSINPESSYNNPKIEHCINNEWVVESKSIDKVFPVKIFLWEELEALSMDNEKQRNLIDNDIKENILIPDSTRQEYINKIKINNKTIIQEAYNLSEIIQTDDFKEYPDRIIRFNKLNKSELKEKFAELDKITEQGISIKKMIEMIQKLISGLEKFEETEQLEFIKSEIEILKTDDLVDDFSNELVKLIEDIEKWKIDWNKLLLFLNAIKEKLEQRRNILADNYKDKLKDLGFKADEVAKEKREDAKTKLDKSKIKLEEYCQIQQKIEKLIENNIENKKNLDKETSKISIIRKKHAKSINKIFSFLPENKIKIKVEYNIGIDKKEFMNWLKEYVKINSVNKSQFNVNQQNKLIELLNIKDIIKISFSKSFEDVSSFTEKTDEEHINRIFQNFNIYEYRLDNEKLEELRDKIGEQSLPEIVRQKIPYYNIDRLEKLLKIFMLYFEDEPNIHLNDRPGDTHSQLRAIKNLSPGQRCSAILPLVLLSGKEPIVIDQPEDNLDTKLIRDIVVDLIRALKLKRQIIIATHNANLPVLGDAEQIITLEATGDKKVKVINANSIDNQVIIDLIVSTMEGGREAFDYRGSLYGINK